MISSCCSHSKSLSLCHPSLCTVVSGIFWDGFGATKIERSRWIPALLFRWCGSTTADGGDDLIHVGKAMIMPLWMIMVTTLTWIDGWYMLIWWPMEMDGNGKLGEWWILLLCWHYWWFIAVDPISSERQICTGCDACAAKRNLWSAIGIASFAFLCYLEFPEDVVNFWWTNKWIHGWMFFHLDWTMVGCSL